MTFKEALIEHRNSTGSAYITFIVNYDTQDDSYHLFYEGADDLSFYTNFIENILLKPKYTYKCNGKKKLYEIYKKINWDTTPKSRVLFFADKDFSDILNEKLPTASNIFVTKYYSIENYLVDEYLLKRTIVENLSITNEKIVNHLIEKYNEALEKFKPLALSISAWIIFTKRKEEIVLNNIRLTDIFQIDNNLNFKRQSGVLNYLITTTNPSHKENVFEIRNTIKELQKYYPDYKFYLRGKFEMAFFIEFISKICEYLNKGRAKGEKTFSYTYYLTQSNAIAFLGPRQKQPDDLKAFLSNILN